MKVILTAFVAAAFACVAAAAAPTTDAFEPAFTLRATAPTGPVPAGDDIALEVTLSTEDEAGYSFLLGSFAQCFGLYILGPWGPVQPGLARGGKTHWMHQEHSAAGRVRVARGQPYRTRVRLSDYFRIRDREAFKAGTYQINVKFFESGLPLATPVDSGAVRFEITGK